MGPARGVSPASPSSRPAAVPESPTSSRLVVVARCAAPRPAARRRRAGRDRPPGSGVDRHGADRSRGARCSARLRSGDIVALPRTGIRAARRYRSAGRRTSTQVSAPGHRSHHPTRCPGPIQRPGRRGTAGRPYLAPCSTRMELDGARSQRRPGVRRVGDAQPGRPGHDGRAARLARARSRPLGQVAAPGPPARPERTRPPFFDPGAQPTLGIVASAACTASAGYS